MRKLMKLRATNHWFVHDAGCKGHLQNSQGWVGGFKHHDMWCVPSIAGITSPLDFQVFFWGPGSIRLQWRTTTNQTQLGSDKKLPISHALRNRGSFEFDSSARVALGAEKNGVTGMKQTGIWVRLKMRTPIWPYIYIYNVNPGLINHGLLIRGYPPNSHNMVHKWHINGTLPIKQPRVFLIQYIRAHYFQTRPTDWWLQVFAVVDLVWESSNWWFKYISAFLPYNENVLARAFKQPLFIICSKLTDVEITKRCLARYGSILDTWWFS